MVFYKLVKWKDPALRFTNERPYSYSQFKDVIDELEKVQRRVTKLI